MTVYIVTKNDDIDAVFLDKQLAINHRNNLISKWNMSSIIEKVIYDF